METILVLAHTEADGSLAKPALEAIAAAKSLGGTLVVGLVGENVQAAANRIASCGAAKFLTVSGADFAQPRYVTDAAAAEAIAKAANATVIVAPATSRWNRVLSGVAHRLGGCADTHVTTISLPGGAISVNRWYYRQRMEAVIQRAQRPWVIALDPGCVATWQGDAGTATVENVAVALADAQKRTAVTGVKAPAADQQTIRPDAPLLLVAGAGWTKKQADGQAHAPEAEKLILSFLKLTQASLGGSKSVVDLGGEGQDVLSFMTHLHQIGQTGSTPRHQKGLSTCCHGEEPHTVGWRFVNERRAISLDANCGWARGKADVLYVADAFAVMVKVNELLAAKKST
jgi:electron transfer flavoprotein alpha subunit